MLSKLHFTIWSVLAVLAIGVSGPDLSCNAQEECKMFPWTAPYPTCVNKACRCGTDKCLVYTSFGNGVAFYCGECGVLGSECNETNPCVQIPMLCKSDHFCHCDQGAVFRELCVVYKPIATTFKSDVLIVILVALLVLLRVIKSWETIKRLLCRIFPCRRCSGTESEESTVVGVNPRSGEKSAAYTIANADFMTTSHDTDLEWALEISRQLSSPTEEWLSMRSFTQSSASSSSRSRNRFYDHASVGAASEPGSSRDEQRGSSSLHDFPTTPSDESSSSFSVSNTYPSRRPSNRASTTFRRLNSLSFLQSTRSSSVSSGSFHSADSSVKRNSENRSASVASSVVSTSREFSSSRGYESFSHPTQASRPTSRHIRGSQNSSSSSSTSRPSVSSETNTGSSSFSAEPSAVTRLRLPPVQKSPSTNSKSSSSSPPAESELDTSQQIGENISSFSDTSSSSSRENSFQSLSSE